VNDIGLLLEMVEQLGRDRVSRHGNGCVLASVPGSLIRPARRPGQRRELASVCSDRS
jgi:hypothetical protein